MTANNSNATPKGQVTVKVRRSAGGYKFTDSPNYRGGKVCFTTTKLDKRGKYIVYAVFDRKPGSKFKDSDNRTTFNVTRRG